MVSPNAIEHVNDLMDQIEGQNAPEVSTSCRDRGMLEVWADVLRERGYRVRVHWKSRIFGFATMMTAQMEGRRILVSHTPEVPAWIPVGSDPGERTLRINEPPEGKKIDVVLLIREMRPDWSLKEARECMKGEHPLFEKVGMATSEQVISYLALVGWSAQVS